MSGTWVEGGDQSVQELLVHFIICLRALLPFQTQDTWEFSIQPHPTYLSTLKICRVGLCTELFYAIIPTCFYVFWWFDILLYFINVFLFLYSMCVCVVGTRSVVYGFMQVCMWVCVCVSMCVCAQVCMCMCMRESVKHVCGNGQCFYKHRNL